MLAGAERYRSITSSHIRNADGIILVYDINSELSFQTLDYWVDLVRKTCSEDVIVYLLGNKLDLAEEDSQMRRVNKTSAIEFVNKNNLVHWAECSAKTNKNIKETFKNFYLRIYLSQKTKLDEKTKNMKKLIIENSLKTEPQSKCC